MRSRHIFKWFLPVLAICFAFSACAKPAPTQVATDALPEDVNSILDKTQIQVASLRGLEAPSNLPRTFLTPGEIKEKVINDFLVDYTPDEAARDAKSFWMLGLLPKDFALLDFYRELYSEQIGGYYDEETNSMYVVQSGGFSIVEQSTYAHEFVHALQDHNFDFNDTLGYSDEACEENSERCAALQALIEGDASLTQSLWFNQNASNQDLTDLQTSALTMQMPIYNSAPAFMREDLTFPYLVGQQFVTQLYAQGGFEAIDKAFTELQPLSTEQIMHPSRYPDDKPTPIELPDLAGQLGKDWTVVETDSLGEWFGWLLLARGYEPKTRLNDTLASAAMEGWGGDDFVILKNTLTGEQAIVIQTIWDTPKDEEEAYLAHANWLSLRFGVADSTRKYVSNGITARLQASNNGGFYLILTEKPTTSDLLLRLLP